MTFETTRQLGLTGLTVGRLGVACSYGAPTEAFEEAFDHGVNYFYWGSQRKSTMARAIRNLIARGQRDELVIVIQSYSRSALLMEVFFQQALKKLGIDTADVLLLGWHNRRPAQRILDRALQMQEKGMCRYLALSGHNRLLFPKLSGQEPFDIFHVRYNAVHRGAEEEVFAKLAGLQRPGVVTYTATRWGDLLRANRMPPDTAPLSGADCYRFVLTHPDVDVCMTGPSTRAEMREALKALALGPLSEEELQRVRAIGDYIHTRHKRPFFG